MRRHLDRLLDCCSVFGGNEGGGAEDDGAVRTETFAVCEGRGDRYEDSPAILAEFVFVVADYFILHACTPLVFAAAGARPMKGPPTRIVLEEGV